MSPKTDDGTQELRGSLLTAFPQLTPRDVQEIVDVARSLNEKRGGA